MSVKPSRCKWAAPSSAACSAVCCRIGADRLPMRLGTGRLLADTKTAEYFSQQIVAAEFAGDFPQGQLRPAQFLGEQLEGARLCQYLRGLHHAGSGAIQRIEMAAPRRQRTRVAAAEPCAIFQVSAQQIKAHAGPGAQEHLRRIAEFIDLSLRAAQVDLVEDQRDRHTLRQLTEFGGQV